jgi:hypothetical protein
MQLTEQLISDQIPTAYFLNFYKKAHSQNL